MKLPKKLIKTKSQVTTGIVSLLLYVVCSAIFSTGLISETKLLPFLLAMGLALIFQDAEPRFERDVLGITLVNGLVIFVGAYGFSYAVPNTTVRVVAAFSDGRHVAQMPVGSPEDKRDTPMVVLPGFFRSWDNQQGPSFAIEPSPKR